MSSGQFQSVQPAGRIIERGLLSDGIRVIPVQRNAKARALPEAGYVFPLRHLGDGEPAYVGSTSGQANLLMEAGSVTSPAINPHDLLKFAALGVAAGISGAAFGQGQRCCSNHTETEVAIGR